MDYIRHSRQERAVKYKGLAQKREKYSILIALVASNAVSIVLAVLMARNWRGPFRIANMISNNPTRVGIIVQITSQLLGLIIVQALCILLNLTARLKLATESLSLESLKFSNALACNRIDFTVNRTNMALLMLFAAFNMLPAALWAGALTPVVTTSTVLYPIRVPDYSDISGIAQFSESPSNYSKVDNLGTHTFDPEFQLAGQILGNARDAFSPSGGISPHAKLDKTGYVYQARSYGIGSAVGLVNKLPEHASFYEYSETGLKSSANCTYNETSGFYLEWLCCPPDAGWTLVIFNARGILPNGAPIMDAAASMGKNRAFALGAGVRNSSAYLALTTYTEDGEDEGPYASLDKIQCELSYKPYDFLVSVNVTQKSIHITPQRRAGNFSHHEDWAISAIDQIRTMSSMVATTQWRSILGDNLLNNIANVAMAQGKGNSSNLLGVATAVESMIDGMLEATSAAQMVVLKSYHSKKARAQIPSFVLGSYEYIYSILALNLVVTLLFITQMVRTHGWERAPMFNFVDIKDVILHAAAPGNRIFEVASQISTGDKDENAGLDDDLLGSMRVRFVNGERQSKLLAQMSTETGTSNSYQNSSSPLKNNPSANSSATPLVELQPPSEEDAVI